MFYLDFKKRANEYQISLLSSDYTDKISLLNGNTNTKHDKGSKAILTLPTIKAPFTLDKEPVNIWIV